MTGPHETMMTFLPNEQRYVASCYPLPDRPGIEACLDWRETFNFYAKQQMESLSFMVSRLMEPFPHLTRLAIQGLFKKISIQDYFEGLDFPETSGGIPYHNPNLYLFAARIGRQSKNMSDKTALISVLDHVSGCSVKPAKLSTSTITDYRGEKNELIDRRYLLNETTVSDYALVHGLNHQGKHQAIRYITQAEYQKFSDWFAARQQSKQNPFNNVL